MSRREELASQIRARVEERLEAKKAETKARLERPQESELTDGVREKAEEKSQHRDASPQNSASSKKNGTPDVADGESVVIKAVADIREESPGDAPGERSSAEGSLLPRKEPSAQKIIKEPENKPKTLCPDEADGEKRQGEPRRSRASEKLQEKENADKAEPQDGSKPAEPKKRIGRNAPVKPRTGSTDGVDTRPKAIGTRNAKARTGRRTGVGDDPRRTGRNGAVTEGAPGIDAEQGERLAVEKAKVDAKFRKMAFILYISITVVTVILGYFLVQWSLHSTSNQPSAKRTPVKMVKRAVPKQSDNAITQLRGMDQDADALLKNADYEGVIKLYEKRMAESPDQAAAYQDKIDQIKRLYINPLPPRMQTDEPASDVVSPKRSSHDMIRVPDGPEVPRLGRRQPSKSPDFTLPDVPDMPEEPLVLPKDDAIGVRPEPPFKNGAIPIPDLGGLQLPEVDEIEVELPPPAGFELPTPDAPEQAAPKGNDGGPVLTPLLDGIDNILE